MISCSCPTCGSQYTRRLSLEYASGIRVSNSGWRSQTYSSMTAAPPAKRRYRWRLLLVILPVGAIAVQGAELALLTRASAVVRLEALGITAAVLAIPLLAGFAIVARAVRYNRRTWPTLLAQWQREFRCMRCGASFVPSAKAEDTRYLSGFNHMESSAAGTLGAIAQRCGEPNRDHHHSRGGPHRA